MLGIENLRIVIDFGLSTEKLLVGLMNGVGLEDLGRALRVATKVPEVVKDAGPAFQEYMDLTDVEAADLETYVQTEFGVPENGVEAAIEKGIQLAIQMHGLLQLIAQK